MDKLRKYNTLKYFAELVSSIDILSSLDKTYDFEAVKFLIEEGYLRGEDYKELKECSSYLRVRISEKGLDFIAKYEEDSAPFYKKVMKFNVIERGMKITKFVFWIASILTGCILAVINW